MIKLTGQFRQAELTDIKDLARLSGQLGYPCPDSSISANLKSITDDPDHLVLVAEADLSSLAGFVHVFITKRLFTSPFAEIGGLVVDNSFQGEGIGSKLITKAENWAVSNGVQIMRIRSNITRNHARVFYLSKGYNQDKQQRVFSKHLS
jgi:GNAT superfamily N-acetyltransferase